MVYNTRSVKEVIAKVYRDLSLSEKSMPMSDMVEWAGEALDKIGAFQQYNIKVTGRADAPLLEVSNYQARLPKDLFRLVGVQYSETSSGTFSPMRYGSGIFDYRPPIEDSEVDDNQVHSENSIVYMAMYVYDINYETALNLVNTDPSVRERMNTLLDSDYTPAYPQVGDTKDLTYVINNSYIKLNVPTGYLKLAYLATPLDPEGFPIVPDDPAFMEAIYWYILMKMMYPKWLLGQMRDRQYYDIRRSWNFYCKQAYAHAMMPNLDKLESMKNQDNKLYPEMNEHANSFNTLGEQQILWNH